MATETLHWVDYFIIISSVLLTVYMGIHFANRQKSSDNFFAGGRNIPSWAIGVSIFATLISSVTFLAYPSAAYASNWILLVQGLMVPVTLIAIIWLVVPLFRKVIRLSTYEYFERRFGFFARLYSSLAFVLIHFSKMGTVLYLVSLALSAMTGVNVFLVVGSLSLVIIILTILGGIEAVIWMDVIQGFLLIGGGILCVLVLLFTPEGGPTAIFNEIRINEKIDFGPYTWDFTEITFIVMVFNGAFYAIQKYGTDQTIVQRYLTAKSDKEAKKAAYIGVFMSVPIWALFMFIGSALFAYYRIYSSALPSDISVDAILPFFIMSELPVGAIGLVVAALAAAAISSLDSDMNSLAAIGVEDYYLRWKPDCTDKQRLNMGRILVLISGLAAMGVACLYIIWEGEGVLKAVFGIYAIFSAGVVGIFLLGILTRSANKQGLYIGIAACVLFTAYAVMTSTKMDFGNGSKLLIDLGIYNFSHHKYMLGVYSHLIVFIIGYLASFFFKSEKADESLTIYGYFKNMRKGQIN